MKKILISLLVMVIFIPQTSALDKYQVEYLAESTYKSAVVTTDHFWIEYSDQFYAPSVVPDKNQNSVHDAVDYTAELLDEVWEKELALGFQAPVGSEEDGRILVILDEDYDYLTEDYLGVTYIDSNFRPFIVLDFNRILSGDEQDEEDYRMTVAHEFFHAIQFGYDPYFWSFYEDLNFSEATASAVAEYVLEDVSLSDAYAPLYFYSYSSSLYGSNQLDPAFPYASYLWPKFLMANYGEEVLVRVFEEFFAMSNSGDYFVDMYKATDQALQANYNTTIYEAFKEFTIWNYDVDLYGDETLEDGVGDYWLADYVSEYPAFSGVADAQDYYSSMTSPLGASYVRFDTDSIEENLKITVFGQADAKWMATILTTKYHTDTKEYDSRIVYQDEEEVSFLIQDASQYTDIVMILSPIPGTFYVGSDFDQFYTYSYYAEDVRGAGSGGTMTFEEGAQVEAVFSDVSINDDYFYPVKVLKNRGVIEGYKNSTFQVARAVSRAEVVKMLVVSMVGDDAFLAYQDCFDDVTGDWYEGYVCYAESQGWVEGYSDGNFYPMSGLDRATAVKLLLAAYGVEVDDDAEAEAVFADVDAGDWYSPYLGRAYRWGLFDEKEGYRFDPGRTISRGEFSDLLYRLMSVVDFDVDEKGIEGVDVRDYFVFDEGVEMKYAVYADDERVGTETVATIGECEGYPVCIALESGEGRAYYYYLDNEVRVYKEVRDGGEVDYFDPLLLLATEDSVEYAKVADGVMLYEGTEMEIIDVVNIVDVDWAAYVFADDVKYDLPLKVTNKQIVNFRMIVGKENFYGTMEIDAVSYWVEEVGMVKKITNGVTEFMGVESEDEERVWEML